MPKQVQKQKASTKKQEEQVEELPETTSTGEDLKSDMDNLLDEIDEVLETNAQDFVSSYIQKGGE